METKVCLEAEDKYNKIYQIIKHLEGKTAENVNSL